MEVGHYIIIQPVCATLEEDTGKVMLVFSNSDQDEFLPVETDPFEAEMFIREMMGESLQTAAVFLSEVMAKFPSAEAVLHPELQKIEFSFDEPAWRHGRFVGLADGITLVRRLGSRFVVHEEAFDVRRDDLDKLTASGAIAKSSVYFDPDFPSATSPYIRVPGASSLSWNMGDDFPPGFRNLADLKSGFYPR